MVSSVDFFYISLSIGFLVLVGFASYSLYNLALTFKAMQKVAENVAETTQDLTDLKNTIKRGALKFFIEMVANRFKGGDN